MNLQILPFKRIALFTFFSAESPGIGPWLQRHLLPCPFKWLTGMDCPGCGFQRALLLLLEGQWKASFLRYPALLPLLALGIFFLFKAKIPNRYARPLSLLLSGIAGCVLFISYLQKMYF